MPSFLAMHTAITHERDGFILCFIRLDVFHPVLGTDLQKNLQACFPRSAWGILRQEHGFSKASPPWVQTVGDMLGFAILPPGAIPQAAAQHVPSRLTVS